MNLTIVSILFCFTVSAFALSNNIRNDSDYLIYEPKIVKDEIKSPELKIFASPDLSGNPVIEIDEKGLKVEGKLVCTFDKAEPTYFRSLKPNSIGCKDYPPIHSENYDSVGAGTFLAIYVEGLGTSQYFEVKYKGKSAYLDKQNLSDFKYYISKEKENENKRTEENQKFQQVLRDDSSLREYLSGLRVCFKNKDKNCLRENKADYNISFRNFLIDACGFEDSDLAVNPANVKYGRYCPSPESFGYDSSGNKISPKDDRRSKEKIASDQDKIKKMIDVYWSHYHECFKSENPYELEGKVFFLENGNRVAQVEIYESGKREISCTVYKSAEKKDKVFWTAIRLK